MIKIKASRRKLMVKCESIHSSANGGVWKIEIEEAPLIKIYTLPAIE
jgi:hypothetical protein